MSAPVEPTENMQPELPPQPPADAGMTPETEPPRGTAASSLPDNPFARMRLKMLLLWAPLVLVALLIGGAFLHMSGALPVEDVSFAVLLGTAWTYGTLCLWFLWEGTRHGLSFRCLFRWPQSGFSWLKSWWPVVPVMVCSMGITLLFFLLLAKIAPDHAISYLNTTIKAYDTTETQYPVFYLSTMLMAILVLAPVMEEIVFRGVLLNRWTARYGARKAIVLSALVFALVHVISPATFFLGLLAGIAYVRTRSLLVPIYLHFVNNLLAVVCQWGTTIIFGADEEMTLETLHQEAFTTGIPMAIVGLAVFGWYVFRVWPKVDATMPYAPQECLTPTTQVPLD